MAAKSFYRRIPHIRYQMNKAGPVLPSSPSAIDRRMQSLARVNELTADLVRVEDIGVLLKRIAESVREIFGFQSVTISILDDKNEFFAQHSMVGHTAEEEADIVNHPEFFSRDSILNDLREDCRISRIAYYIPVEKHRSAAETFLAVRDKKAAKRPRASPASWHELDLLYFALLSRKGDIIGYLQVDYPKDGKLQSTDTVEQIELFANLAALGIENSNLFRRTQSLLTENEVKAKRMVKLFELIQSVLRVGDLDTVLQKVSDVLAATFEYRKTGVSLLTKGSTQVTVHAMTGYSEEEVKDVRARPIIRDIVLSDFKEEFRVTRTGYFIPGESQGNGSSFVFVENPERMLQPRTTPDSWHELDLLYFAMYDRAGEMLGYIQLDYPLDGKIPTKETMAEMEAFADIATIAVENSATFTAMQDARRQVGMYLDLLTHDVGNLINPVNAYLEVVMGTTSLTPGQFKYLSSAQEATRSIIHLVRNVRRSAQMLETIGVELVPTNLTKSLKQTATEARNTYLARKVNIRLNLPEQDMWVMADSLIDEIGYNILTNAIKYDEHEEVMIDIDTEVVELEGKKYISVRITDRGSGIPDDLKDKVFSREFKKLYRPERSAVQKARGAGMGLSLVKSLVDRYGGKIWVENRVYEDCTRGSTFAFMLPKP